MSSNSQDAHNVAHVVHDTGEAEMKQLSLFQHLEKMVKLIATQVGLGQDPFVGMPTMVPTQIRHQMMIRIRTTSQKMLLNLYHLRNEGNLMILYALRTTTVLLREMVYFSILPTLSWTRLMLMKVSQNMQVTTPILSNN